MKLQQRVLQELTLTERELLELAPDPAAWSGLCANVEEKLQELEFAMGDLVDHALGTGPAGERWPPSVFARELLDRLAWKLQTHASAEEVELALQWVAACQQSLFNQRRKRS